MLDMQKIDAQDMNTGMLLLRDEFSKRNWHAQIPHIGSPHVFIDRGDGKTLHIFSTTPPTTTYAAGSLANNKYATYEILNSIGVRQLETVRASETYPLDEALDLLRDVGRVVVKPIDGGHGKGITVNVTDETQLTEAITYGLQFTQSMNRVIVQRQYPHDKMHDIRLACINNVFVAAIERVPARVIGDGQRSIKELIEHENTSGRRGVPYYAELSTIDLNRAENFLGDTINDVPQAEEEMQVIGVANYGAGGELVDITDDVPQWMIDEAELVSRTSGLYVSGIDYITSLPLRTDASQEELDAYIIEINKCPSLAIHDKPTSGIPRATIPAYVEYLSTI